MGKEECKEVKRVLYKGYTIVQDDCIGPVGPRYITTTIYTPDGKEYYPKEQDSCIIAYQPDSKLYIKLDTCRGLAFEIHESKLSLEDAQIDSIIMFSNQLKLSKKLSKNQVLQFVRDWNKSKSRGYEHEPFDSAFSYMIPYQYKILVYGKSGVRPFYGYNYVILDSSQWKYEMSPHRYLKYFHEYWNEEVKEAEAS